MWRWYDAQICSDWADSWAALGNGRRIGLYPRTLVRHQTHWHHATINSATVFPSKKPSSHTFFVSVVFDNKTRTQNRYAKTERAIWTSMQEMNAVTLVVWAQVVCTLQHIKSSHQIHRCCFLQRQTPWHSEKQNDTLILLRFESRDDLAVRRSNRGTSLLKLVWKLFLWALL